MIQLYLDKHNRNFNKKVNSSQAPVKKFVGRGWGECLQLQELFFLSQVKLGLVCKKKKGKLFKLGMVFYTSMLFYARLFYLVNTFVTTQVIYRPSENFDLINKHILVISNF